MLKLFLKSIFLFTTACASSPLESPLKKSMPMGFQNEVFVLGTMHLSGHKELTPSHLDKVIKRLSNWNPTQICVESRHPREIHEMVQLAPFNKGVANMLKQFDQYKVDLAEIENKKYKFPFFKAYSMLQNELTRKNIDSFKVIQLALISYDFPNAVLYWSKLSATERQKANISKESKKKLNKWLKSKNETTTLSIRLAKEKNIKSLCSIDSQMAGTKVLAASDKDIEVLFSSPARAAWRDRLAFKKLLEVKEKAFKEGDLLPAYLYLNNPKVALDDETQWEWLYEDRTKTGLNRVRFVSWDLRNSQIAKNIIEFTQKHEKQRVLVVIGSAHKSIVERMLKASSSISVDTSALTHK